MKNKGALVPTPIGRNANALSPALLFSSAKVPFALAVPPFVQRNVLPAFAKQVPRVAASRKDGNRQWEEYAYAHREGRVVLAGYAQGHEEIGRMLHRMELGHGETVSIGKRNYAVRRVRDSNRAKEALGCKAALGVGEIAALAKLASGETFVLVDVGSRKQVGESGMQEASARSLARIFARAHANGERTGGICSAKDVFASDASAAIVSAHVAGEGEVGGLNEFCISVALLLGKGAIGRQEAMAMVQEYVAHSPIVRMEISAHVSGKRAETLVHELGGQKRGSGRVIVDGSKQRKLKVDVRSPYARRAMARVLKFMQLL